MSEELPPLDEAVNPPDTGSEVPDPVAPDFRSMLDPSFANDPAIAKFTNVNDLVKEHVNLQGVLGRKGIIKPSEGDEQVVWDNWRKEMGIPENVEGYELERFSTPEGIDWNNDFQSTMAAKALELDLSKDQFAGLLESYAAFAANEQGNADHAAAESLKEGLAELKAEWGRSYDARALLGANALSELTDDPAAIANTVLRDGTKLGDQPAFIKMMAAMGERMQEKGLIGENRVNTATLSPEEAQRKLNEMMTDSDKFSILFEDASHPMHRELVRERERLLELAYPDEVA
jgi:hypothetical protein